MVSTDIRINNSGLLKICCEYFTRGMVEKLL